MDYSNFYNGRPCKACTSAEEIMRLGQKIIAQKENLKDDANSSNEKQKTNDNNLNNLSQTNNFEQEDQSRLKRIDCPVDKDLLGNSTWNLLHTISVYYPEKPNQNQQNDIKNLLESLSKVHIFKKNTNKTNIFFRLIHVLLVLPIFKKILK